MRVSRHLSLLAGLLLSFALAACVSGRQFSWDHVRQLRPGMGEDDVLKIMGPPEVRAPGRGRVTWAWFYDNALTGESQRVFIPFLNGVVEEVPSVPDGDRNSFSSGGSVALLLPQTPEERQELVEATHADLGFTMPETDAQAAWGRGQSWLGRFSSMKLQTATDYVVETFNPTRRGQYGYRVTRAPEETGMRFDVACIPSAPPYAESCRQNAQILAHYIRTGRLACERCIDR